MPSLQVIQMEGYGGKNYKVVNNGQVTVLKYYEDATEFDLVQAQNLILTQIANQVSIEVPVPLSELKPTQSGFARLLTYLPGDFLDKSNLTPSLMYSFGGCIADMHIKLRSLRNAQIASRRTPWDLKFVMDNAPKLIYITNHSDRSLVDYFLDQFQYRVLSIQDEFEWAIIHNDLNENNVLVGENKIKGFIDFGDIAYSPMVYDLGIALTYCIMLRPTDWEETTISLIKGYQEHRTLNNIEIASLYLIIAARLCTSVLNSAEAKQLNTDTDYILISEKSAWKTLRFWITLNPIQFENTIRQSIGKEIPNSDTEAVTTLRKLYGGTSLSLSYSEPIHMNNAAFQYMYTASGETYLDAYNNIPLVGHCHPRVSRAISAQARSLNTNTRYIYNQFASYTELLLSFFPPQLNKVYLVNSGSEASDLAIRMARTVTDRKTIAVLEHGYHGHTSEGIKISSYKFAGKGGLGAASDIIVLPLPNAYGTQGKTGTDFANDAIAILNDAILMGNRPAALIVEPISGCGGQVPLATDYLKTLKPYLERNGILLISDEVQVGFGRLGDWFWGFEMHEVEPDIVVIGKPMGNCHPIGGVVTTQTISDQFANGMEFFSSFGGNPVSCAVGEEVLRIIEDEELQANAKRVGDYFIKQLQLLQEKYINIGDVRGKGLFIGIEITTEKGQPSTTLAKHLKEGLKAAYILTSTDGPFDNVIKIKPPLCFTIQNVDRVIRKLSELLASLVKD